MVSEVLMTNKKNRSKKVNRGERERLNKRRQEVDEAHLQEAEEMEPEFEQEVQEEELEKDGGEMTMAEQPYMGPTSFEELDALRTARERAEQVQEVTWDTQDLVRNILYSPTIDEGQKAQKIMDVAGGFKARLSQSVGEDMKKDMEVLEIEAMLAMDERETARHPIKKGAESLVEFAKKKLSYGARQNLSDSDFALVYTDSQGNKQRKYPIYDKAHVRNALARAAQQIQGGGQGAADARKALPKIRAAAKKFGISMAEKGLHIEKDAKGDWRWIGRPSNNFIDLQTDIMIKEAHQKYVAWLDENPDMAPVFLSWHTPGTARENPADFWMEHEGFLIMSGKLTEPEARSLLSMQKQVDLGMSLQGVGVRLNKQDPRQITDYWLYEVSDLPLDNAANPFTNLETITKEVGMDKLEYLTEVLGSKEKAQAYLEKTGQMQKQLQEAGITSKEVGTPADETTKLEVDALVPQIVKALKEEFGMDELSAAIAQLQEAYDKVPLLEGMVKDLMMTADERLANQLQTPNMRYAWLRDNRASQSKSTKLDKADEDDDEDDEALMKAGPEAHWLSQVTHTAPIPADEEVSA